MGAGLLMTNATVAGPNPFINEPIKIGLIGCGGRGTGAAAVRVCATLRHHRSPDLSGFQSGNRRGHRVRAPSRRRRC